MGSGMLRVSKLDAFHHRPTGPIWKNPAFFVSFKLGPGDFMDPAAVQIPAPVASPPSGSGSPINIIPYFRPAERILLFFIRQIYRRSILSRGPNKFSAGHTGFVIFM